VILVRECNCASVRVCNSDHCKSKYLVPVLLGHFLKSEVQRDSIPFASKLYLVPSVADPDPGSSGIQCFFDLGIRDGKNPYMGMVHTFLG
jgi:hypothetical protein